MYTNDTRLLDLTVGDLKTLIRETAEEEEARRPDKADKVIRGCKAIAAVLGISERTLGEWKRNGIIGAPTLRQVKKTIMANESDLLAFRPKNKTKAKIR